MLKPLQHTIFPLLYLIFGNITSHSALAQPEELGSLPWQEDRLSDQIIPFSITNSTTARQMLEIAGIGDSQLRFLIDYEPISGKDIDTTGHVLRNFYELDSSDIKRWSNAQTLDTATLLNAFLETPDDYRVDFYRIRGTVIRVQRQPIVEEAARLLGFRSFFWVWMKPQNSNISVRIATRKLPIAWFPSEWKTTGKTSTGSHQAETGKKPDLAPDASFELNRPAAVNGLLLKVAEEHNVALDEPEQGRGVYEVVLAAQRVEWLPQKASANQGINAGVAILSKYEFDAGLLDEVRKSNGKKMNRSDTEAFFQIMSIVKSTEARREIEVIAEVSPPTQPSISDYLQNTGPLQGEFIKLDADVRQITKVEISNKKMKHRLGIDHYWQLDAFVYLGDEAIELKTKEDDKEGLIYKYRYPVQICLIDLPAELQTAQTQIQHGTYRRNSLHEDITLNGFFFKLWTYQSARTIEAGGSRAQLSPLFITNHVVVHKPTGLNSTRSSIYLGVSFVVLLLVIAGLLIRTNRVDDGFRKQTETTRHAGGLDEDLLSDLEFLDEHEEAS